MHTPAAACSQLHTHNVADPICHWRLISL